MKMSIVTVLFCFSSVLAQEQTITMNGAELKLGMPKMEVLDLLGSKNNVSKRSWGVGNWCAKPKDDRSADPCPLSLSFTNDKLVIVSKSRGMAYGDDAADVMNGFFTEMSKIQQSGRDCILFATHEYETDSIRIRQVSFRVGNRELSLEITQGLGGRAMESSVGFGETLMSPAGPSRGEKPIAPPLK